MGRLGTGVLSPGGVKPVTPILQLGGLQEANRVAPPRLFLALALLLPVALVVVVKAATSGLVVLQVRGGVARGVLLATPHRLSTAIAVTPTLVPLVTVMEFPCPAWPLICR